MIAKTDANGNVVKDAQGNVEMITVRTGGKIFDQFGPTPPRQDPNGVTLFLKSSQAKTIMPGGKDLFQIIIQNPPVSLQVPTRRGTTTFRAGTNPKGDPPSELEDKKGNKYGLVSYKTIGDPEFYILNDPEDPFDFLVRDLQFLTDVSPVSDSTMFLDFSQSFGFGPSQPDVVMHGFDAESGPFFLPNPTAGHGYYARGTLIVAGVEMGRFAVGEFTVVPEPSTLAMGGIGAVVGLVCRWRARKRIVPM
jgi:hypothetical protein